MAETNGKPAVIMALLALMGVGGAGFYMLSAAAPPDVGVVVVQPPLAPESVPPVRLDPSSPGSGPHDQPGSASPGTVQGRG
jgi:hypothetical protein